MDSNDYAKLAELISRTAEMYGRPLTAGAIEMYCSALRQYGLAEVRAALDAHAKDPEGGRFMPLPAHLIGHLQANDGRPSADEAWSMCPRSEYESVVWTEEMAQAYGLAAPLLEHGDQVAARKAFIDRYESLVAKSRAAGVPVKVTPSFGWDAAGREAAVLRAVERGLIAGAQVAHYLRIAAPVDEGARPALPMPELKRLQ